MKFAYVLEYIVIEADNLKTQVLIVDEERTMRRSSLGQGMRKAAVALIVACALLFAGTPAYAAVTQEQLESHVVEGLNPANTKVNLFDYDTGERGAGNTDTLGTTGGATPSVNYNTWLTNPGGINYGRLLTFGDGMRHLGYWNQGIVAAYGDIALSRPGMQNIVAPTLSGGYPVINADDSLLGPNGGAVGAYNSNPELYSTAIRNTNEMIYGNAGPLYTSALASSRTNPLFNPVWGWNIDPAVQAQALSVAAGTGNIDFAALNNDVAINSDTAAGQNLKATLSSGSSPVDYAHGYELPESIRSLQYLFDPDTEASGKESYNNVTGLFQMDDEGYCYYNMRDNFAQYVEDPQEGSDGHFVLYDTPAGLRTDGTNSVGNFFPFNSAANAFSPGADGQLRNALNANNQGNVEPVDHHLGMTVETTFRQPIDGKVGANPMTFEFVGDDDVWVFIDDVLVLDLGGIHSEIYGTIDFSTGDVNMGTAFNSNGEIFNADGSYITEPVIKTNIKSMFDRAGRSGDERWNGNTFASNTSHTLKMFYLERGNYDSSLAVRFNLQDTLYQQIEKVDQFGRPLAGAEFDLYAALPTDGTTPSVSNSSTYTLDNVQASGAALTHLVTDEKGIARFTDPTLPSRDGSAQEPFNFSDRYNESTGEGLLYILRETKAPEGYKSTPQDLLLRFEPDYTMLVVNNRYQVGAYSSFVSHIFGNSAQVFYGQVGPDGGLVDQIPGSSPVAVADQEDGLVVVVPMLKTRVGAEDQWLPLYGDNLDGFKAIHYGEDRDAEYESFKEQVRVVTLKGALMQSAQAQNSVNANGWFLTWDHDTQRLSGYLENLPGRADRYLLQNPESGDMRNFYAIIKPEALMRVLGVDRDALHAMTSEERYEALGQKVAQALAKDGGQYGENVKAILTQINPYDDPDNPDTNNYLTRGCTPLDIKQFVRNFRSRIYIPNEQRELRVSKVDQTGAGRNGATFALYDTLEKAQAADPASAVAQGETATVDGTDGMLIFEPTQGHRATAGYADMIWPDVELSQEPVTYYLREIKAPEGCEINEEIIDVKVGVYSIYADAGVQNDGVTVMAGVGKLAQTMVKYASEGDVNVTLRDITSIAQHQESGAFSLTGWQDTLLPDTNTLQLRRSMNLHYGVNAVVDYGLGDRDGGKNYMPFFVTDTGYVRTHVQQNLNAHPNPDDPYYSTAECDDLGDQDITGLFSLINTVVVTDKDTTKPATGGLRISKTVGGETATAEDFTRQYHFTVELTNEKGESLPESFNYYGRDRAGTVKSGDQLVLTHAEELVVLGIPEGTTFKITEAEANATGFYTYPASGKVEGVVAADQFKGARFFNYRGERPDDPKLEIVKEQKTDGSEFTREKLQVETDTSVTYRLAVTNTGGSTAHEVQVEDLLEDDLIYVEGSASDGGSYDGAKVTWNLGDLEAGATKSVTFQVKVPQVEGARSWENLGTVVFTPLGEEDPGDPVPSNVVEIEKPEDPANPSLPNTGGGSQSQTSKIVPTGDTHSLLPAMMACAALAIALVAWKVAPRRN